jgi:2-polyprenyl-3-methyl-5-hydroxy-6-metoxy-1,4-benzoquinol methylase
MKRKIDTGYNERLFSSGLRRHLHEARFIWIHQKLLELRSPYARVIELGCFDGKVLNFFPDKPRYYVGYDADWEDALRLAREKWKDYPNYHFRYCITPEEMALGEDRFDIAIAMETLEHVPEETLAPYLSKLAEATDQYILITVPNEKGVVFFFKYLIKLLFGEVEKHSVTEFVNAALGRMDRVKRGHHKGFDYERLTRQVAEYFDIVEVTGLPIHGLPTALSFTIGIVARKKPAMRSVSDGGLASAPT